MTIGAPSDVAHVLHQFDGRLENIERDGAAEVMLAGRRFTITKQKRSFAETQDTGILLHVLQDIWEQASSTAGVVLGQLNAARRPGAPYLGGAMR